jgi:ParB family chromosome partitioning protein
VTQNLAGLPEFAAYAKSDATEGAVKLLFAMRNARAGKRGDVSESLVNRVEEIFRGVGATSWHSFVSHRLPLRKLPADVQRALREGWLDYTKAMEMGRLTAERLASAEVARLARAKLLTAVREEQLPVREVKARVHALLNSVNKEKESRNLAVRQQAREILRTIDRAYTGLNERKRERLELLLAQIGSLLKE